jgi:hypothetical protein
MKANWYSQEPNNVFRYAFNGDFDDVPSQCQGSYSPQSGDSNVNTLLQLAYLAGQSVTVGITNDCTVTTVQLQ